MDKNPNCPLCTYIPNLPVEKWDESLCDSCKEMLNDPDNEKATCENCRESCYIGETHVVENLGRICENCNSRINDSC